MDEDGDLRFKKDGVGGLACNIWEIRWFISTINEFFMGLIRMKIFLAWFR